MVNPADQNKLIAFALAILSQLQMPGFRMTRRMAVRLRKAMRRFEIKVRNWLLTLAMYRVADLPPRMPRKAPTSHRLVNLHAPTRTSPGSSYNTPISFRGPVASRRKKHDAKPASNTPRSNSDHLLAAHLILRIAEICKLIRAPEALIAKLARCMQIDTAAHAVRRPTAPPAPYTDDLELVSLAKPTAKGPNTS